ncbi:MAG: hypothetical protein IGR92_07000 [Leptolyngbyaceae cyanobacterium T60_A2020_046]|nr:hypothetical protein [Leptolyngbyaceae cyanobacterium T60_A2020_046]
MPSPKVAAGAKHATLPIIATDGDRETAIAPPYFRPPQRKAAILKILC